MLPSGPGFAFGPFELRLASGELWRDGRPVRLAPQPFQVLALLVARGGSLVSRDELRAAIWSDGTTVEFDQGLNFCIRQIRVSLGDDARRPVYIETVPKRGYRFLVPVSPLPGPGPRETEELLTVASGSTDRVRAPAPVWAVGTLAAVALLVVGQAWSTRPSRPDPGVRRLLIEAEQLAGTWETPKVMEAAARYREAIRLSPSFADAWSGLANTKVVLAQLDSSAMSLAEAEEDARHALALGGPAAAASAALGHVYWQEWRWRDADAAFARALTADADSADTLQLSSLYLASVGRSDEAVARAERAVALAPTSGLINYSLAQVYLHAGRPEAALAQARRTLLLDRHFPLAFRVVLRASALLGRADDALAALGDQSRFLPDRPPDPWRAYVLARLGRADQARQALASDAPKRSLSLAHIAGLVALGEVDRAFERLDRAVSTRAASLIWLKVTPELAPLHGDPRFGALLRRMHCC